MSGALVGPLQPRTSHQLTFAEGAELVNLYHLARAALSGGDDSRYARRLWACSQFALATRDVSATAAYKALDRLLA